MGSAGSTHPFHRTQGPVIPPTRARGRPLTGETVTDAEPRGPTWPVLGRCREAGHLAVDGGLEAKREGIHSARVEGEDRTLHTLEPFVQATWSLGKAQLVPGARLVWSEQWGTHVTPRLSGMMRPRPELALRGSVGRGFRAPTFKELGMELLNTGPGFGYLVRGNPALRPEVSTSVSLGAEWASGPVYLRVETFRNGFDDFIETTLVADSAGLTLYTYDNIDDGFTRGVEVEGGVVQGGLRAEVGYGYLEAENASTGEPLLGRSTHSARVSLDHPLPGGLRGAFSAVYTGATPVRRDEAGRTVEREGFLRLDIRWARPLVHGLDLTLGVRNVLDAQPADWPGYARRHLYLGVGWTRSSSMGSFNSPR